ncbi:MAG: hypothetical protein CM15mP24_3880 [Candidatus Pelagibacterales bacterium]|nr:MAG: hypothetical protein CM15mP24_3880 [Pelagibacterales bacterium]
MDLLQRKNLNYKNKPIEVYKRVDIEFSDADYFYEEIRKELFNKFGKEKLYSEGLVIKTALDSSMQKNANLSLIEGLIEYEKRNGWNGLIENTNLENFLNKKDDYINANPFFPKWKTVIIDKVYQKKLKVFDLNKINFEIDLDNEFNNWLLDVTFNKGDVIYVQKKNNSYIINQEPKVNGAIIVLDPYTGDVLALSGGYSFKKSEFNRATQAKRQPGQLLNQLFI